jgi:AraC-like DNA-binding protein
MDEATAARLEAALVALMEAERPYRRGDLTLPELAEALGVTPHNLTEVVNTRLGQSFYDFVNGYRVREAQARLADPAYAGWTVLAVGLEAGFNSKSSFNAAFKRYAGTTPSAYRGGRGIAA